MLKFIVEGYSTESMEEALADAMVKAAAHMSDSHDVNISILELAMVPGRGYKAVLEITIVPMTNRQTFDQVAQDVEYERQHDLEFRKMRENESMRLKKMIADHFALTMGNLCPDIPDFYVDYLNDSALLNNILEKDFFHSVRQGRTTLRRMPVDVPHAGPATPPLRHVLGKPLRGGAVPHIEPSHMPAKKVS